MANPTWSGVCNAFYIQMSDGEIIRVENRICDVVRWEAKNKKNFVGNTDVSAFLWVAWAAAKREGLTSLIFDEFVDKVDDFAIEGIDRGDPTQRVRMPD